MGTLERLRAWLRRSWRRAALAVAIGVLGVALAHLGYVDQPDAGWLDRAFWEHVAYETVLAAAIAVSAYVVCGVVVDLLRGEPDEEDQPPPRARKGRPGPAGQ
ncbi:MAG: hypothetical protein IT307_11820 [Chloroflexi bacterium]|nr:hypothetical protein [Chloroflexota bacterium]